MTDSPRSDTMPSRFSTPVNELDDHRNQPESLPRAEDSEAAAHHHHQQRRDSRRGTAGSLAAPWPPMLAINDQIQDNGIRSRDFEQAVVDDDHSDDGNAPLSPSGPIVARRNTFRRHRGTNDTARSRGTSNSGRSPSPPNSVDAFAAGRKRSRAGTAGTVSTLGDDVKSIRHSASRHTFERARSPSVAKFPGVGNDEEEPDVEDDVCFPAEVNNNKYTIDFDDLEDFVARQHQAAPVPQALRTKHVPCPACKHSKESIDKTANKFLSEKYMPHVKECPVSKQQSVESSNDSIANEKLETISKPRPADGMKRWSFFSTEIEDSIHANDLGDLLMPGESFQHLFELGPEGGCWWLDMLMPDEEEIEVICKAFGVHGLTREDIIEQETREKVELFKQYYFVCFTSFFQADEDSENYLDPVNVYAVVFREGILTFTFAASPHAENVRKRMSRLRDYVALGADWICYALIDDIVDTFAPVIRRLEQEVDSIEDNVFTARPEDSREMFKQIGDCRKNVMSLMRLLGGKADVIKGFAKRCNEQYSMAPRQDVGLYLSDIQDHVVTMMSNLGHFEKMLGRSHSNYLAQISVSHSMQTFKANQVLSKVTFIATILVPLNLVCGLFGMNVNVPGKDADGLGWWFGILGCLVAFVVISTLIAKRLRFI